MIKTEKETLRYFFSKLISDRWATMNDFEKQRVVDICFDYLKLEVLTNTVNKEDGRELQ